MAVSEAVLELLVKMKDEASAGLSSLGGTLSSLGGIAGGVALAGVAAFGAAVVDGLGDAKESAQLMAQTEAVIKSTGGAANVSAQQVADYASSLSDAAGASLFGDDQIQQSENLLLTFTNIKDKSLEAATAISVDMAQALGGAPKDSAIQLGKALNDPINGITALTRVGVTFTEEQKNQIKTLQESGDMAGAQAVILAELNKEFGGSAKAAADATGGWSELNGRWGEVKETLGAAVLPLLTMLAGFLLDNVIPAVEQAAAMFGPLIQSFMDTGVSSGVLGGAITQLGIIWQALQPVIENVVNAIGAVVLAVFGVVQEFIANHGAEISAFMTDAWNQIMAIIQVGIQLYNAIVPPVLQAIAGFIRDHGEQIQTILGAAWTTIKAIIDGALTIIRGVLTAALQIIQGDWSGAWETIKGTLSRVWDDIKAIISASWDTVKALFGGFASDAVALGAGIIDSAVAGVSSAAGKLSSIISDSVSGAIEAGKRALHDAGVPGFASGVRNFAGGLALVGERGPELVALPRGSNVYSNSDTRSMLAGAGAGGGGIVINVDARGSNLSASQIRAAVRQGLGSAGTSALTRVKTGN